MRAARRARGPRARGRSSTSPVRPHSLRRGLPARVRLPLVPARRRPATRNARRARSRCTSPATARRLMAEGASAPDALTDTTLPSGTVVVAGFGEQLLDHALGLVVGAFAEVMVADAALGVDEVVRRPVLVVERAPDRVVVVDRDRIADLADPSPPCWTLPRFFSNANSGACTPITTRPWLAILLGPGAHVGNARAGS